MQFVEQKRAKARSSNISWVNKAPEFTKRIPDSIRQRNQLKNMAGIAWERDHVADIFETRGEEYKPLKA